MKKCTQTPISGFSFSTTTFTMKDSYSVCAFYHQLGISLVYWFNLFKTHSVLFLTKIAHISKTRDTVYWFVNKAFEALIQYLQNNFQRNYLYYRVPTFLKNIAQLCFNTYLISFKLGLCCTDDNVSLAGRQNKSAEIYDTGLLVS